MKELEEALSELGLTTTEAKIYLAGRKYGAIGVHDIAKHTRLKRPTIYHALETLAEKGLAARRGTGSKIIFSMSPPEHLKNILKVQQEVLQKQVKTLDTLLPLLIQQTPQDTDTISTIQYDGIEGVKMVVDIALFCRKQHWDILAPAKNFFSDFDKKYAAYYLEQRQLRHITSRSLWERGIGRRKLTPIEIKERNPRYLPKTMEGSFKSVLILFDDKVAIISSLQKLSAILITSQEIHDLFAAMFEGVWQSSKELSERK
jgi:sugar-specific transcriptional regulator TrmB